MRAKNKSASFQVLFFFLPEQRRTAIMYEDKNTSSFMMAGERCAAVLRARHNFESIQRFPLYNTNSFSAAWKKGYKNHSLAFKRNY